MKKQSDGQHYQFDMSTSRRSETWEKKHIEQNRAKEYALQIKAERIKVLAALRSNPSLASGLKKYRNALGMTRTEFASEFHLSRRSLYNYENGSRDINGELLERIVERGDVELSELFDLPPEPATLSTRLNDAVLCVELVEALKSQDPNLEIDEELKWFIASAVTKWPTEVKRTQKSVRRYSEKFLRDLSDYYRQTGAYLQDSCT